MHWWVTPSSERKANRARGRLSSGGLDPATAYTRRHCEAGDEASLVTAKGKPEIHLDRRIAEKRVFPSININRSGTRREELLINQEELQKVWILRKFLHAMDEIDAMEFVLGRMQTSKTNLEFFDQMKK